MDKTITQLTESYVHWRPLAFENKFHPSSNCTVEISITPRGKTRINELNQVDLTRAMIWNDARGIMARFHVAN